MTDISLELRRVEYVSDRNAHVSAWRAYVEIYFSTKLNAFAPFACIIDSGAPFSVIPYSFWQTYRVIWNPLGQQLAHQNGTAAPNSLRWQDVSCTLGVSNVHILDQYTGKKTSRQFIVVAKFADHLSQQNHINMLAILGMNFLADNGLRLELDGTGNSMAGKLIIP